MYVTNHFIVSLAVADLVIGAVVMPFSIVLEAGDGRWPFERLSSLLTVCDVGGPVAVRRRLV